MAFTAQDVKALREKTGVGMMECKKALTETDGDMEKAVELLRERGLAAAAKKSGRIAAEGIVTAYTNEAGNVGVVIEVNSETDFVAKNEEFKKFVAVVAKVVADNNPADVDALLEMKPEGSSDTVADMVREKILVIGENIKIRRFARYEGKVVTYVHGDGRIGVMVNMDASDETAKTDAYKSAAKDIAMQVAASFPLYLKEEDIPADVLEKEKSILKEQVINEGKPENIAEKIVMGKLKKYMQDVCLMDQVYIKDSSLSVTKFLEGASKEAGGDIGVKSFVRFERGEGLEKREDNFADEVAGMIK